MARRLVIALTTLLSLSAGLVVGGYLLFFAAAADRLARAVPAQAVAYATVYVQPSSGQKMNLADLLQHVTGFGDPDALDVKLNQIAARLVGLAGVDYEADLRPWLGNQVSVALLAADGEAARIGLVGIVSVKDRPAAAAALDRVAAEAGAGTETYRGVVVRRFDGVGWALLDDLLIVAQRIEDLHAALDAGAGRRSSLAGDARFVAAMRDVPPDHLAAGFLNGAALVAAGPQSSGYPTVSLALVAEPDGLRLRGAIPADPAAAPAALADALVRSRRTAELAAWMPTDTEAALSMFGVAQLLVAAEDRLAADGAATPLTDALNQLRAVAALGLGIDADRDLLPLLDDEVALAVGALTSDAPSLLLLARPSDPQAAERALADMTDRLHERGASVSARKVAGSTLTRVRVPEVVDFAYAMRDGVLLAGLDDGPLAAALEARAAGRSLEDDERYRRTWQRLGVESGNQLYVAVASLADGLADRLALDADTRAILHAADGLGARAPAGEAGVELYGLLSVR